MFTETDGHLTETKIRREFCVVVKRSGIARCGLHDLRRTSLTMLATRLPAFALQQRAGHVSPSTTATFYMGDTGQASAQIAQEVFGKLFKPSGPKVATGNSEG